LVGAQAVDDPNSLHAAELVAFDVSDPALRSRGNPRGTALALRTDPAFRKEIEALFRGEPAGRFAPPSLWDVYSRVTALDEEVADLSRRLDSLDRT